MKERYLKINKFGTGEQVYLKINPKMKLIIGIPFTGYLCKVHGDPAGRSVVYFERELSRDSMSDLKNTSR